MGVCKVAACARYHRDIGLRLRELSQGERELDTDHKAGAKDGPQRLVGEVHACSVTTELRRHLDDFSIDQLHALVRAKHSGASSDSRSSRVSMPRQAAWTVPCSTEPSCLLRIPTCTRAFLTAIFIMCPYRAT